IKQAYRVGIVENTVLYNRIADDVAQFLRNHNGLAPKLSNCFVEIEQVPRHHGAGNRLPGFLNAKTFTAVGTETHFLDENIHNNQRDYREQNPRFLDRIYFKDDKLFRE